jgi:hypothetical protein
VIPALPSLHLRKSQFRRPLQKPPVGRTIFMPRVRGTQPPCIHLGGLPARKLKGGLDQPKA